ncbi:hypothetical protein [Nocardia salmonicida]|uniref:hypothetical protein n=1 Tax=Nocardia salmonicida TaxID=53431 RepID=UPI003CFAE299
MTQPRTWGAWRSRWRERLVVTILPSLTAVGYMYGGMVLPVEFGRPPRVALDEDLEVDIDGVWQRRH